MPAEASGVKPPNFKASIRLDPKPDGDGILRGSSPLKVHFDLCLSNAGDGGGPLTFLYDFDFDGRSDAIDKGDDCTRDHTYNAAGASGKNVSFRSNVCVVKGDPNGHGPDTYFSCRTIQAEVPVPPPPASPGVLNPNSGGCSHSLCQTGIALVGSCDACAGAICNQDPFCCNVAWDGICVGEVQSVCNSNACSVTLTSGLDFSALDRRTRQQ